MVTKKKKTLRGFCMFVCINTNKLNIGLRLLSRPLQTLLQNQGITPTLRDVLFLVNLTNGSALEVIFQYLHSENNFKW